MSVYFRGCIYALYFFTNQDQIRASLGFGFREGSIAHHCALPMEKIALWRCVKVFGYVNGGVGDVEYREVPVAWGCIGRPVGVRDISVYIRVRIKSRREGNVVISDDTGQGSVVGVSCVW